MSVLFMKNSYNTSSYKNVCLHRREVCIPTQLFFCLFCFWWVAQKNFHEQEIKKKTMVIFFLSSFLYWIILLFDYSFIRLFFAIWFVSKLKCLSFFQLFIVKGFLYYENLFSLEDYGS